jgi:DNA-binding CsgD family transcriptional regulator
LSAVLVGRENEIASVERVLTAARSGVSAALVIRGEPGIGKTALLDHAAAAAGGFTILGAHGVESEAELPYAALHQLLHPLLGDLRELTPAQVQAIESAFGMGATPGEPADRFTIGIAVLAILADTAPLLCVLDDAQWFDDESLGVLGFVARRLEQEGVVLLLGVRDDGPGAPLRGLDELPLGRLDRGDARSLLADKLGPPRAGAALETVLNQADGNPLALLELAARAPESAPLPAGPATSYVERAYAEQIAALPTASRTALLVAAAADEADVATIGAATAALGVDLAALEPAERAGLVQVDGVAIRFRHPLARSAAYGAAPFGARRDAHRALAAALSRDEQADRRAWQLAAASTGIDEDVAAELDLAASRARARGGYAAAATALERAAERSAAESARRRRLVQAAEMALNAGALTRAIGLLDGLGELPDPPLARRAAGVRAAVALVQGEPVRALELNLELARDSGQRSPAEALKAARLAVEAAALAGRYERIAELRQLVSDCPPAPGDLDRGARRFVDGLAALVLGDPAGAAPALAEVVALGEHAPDVRDLSAAAAAASYLGRPDQAYALFTRAVARTREAGAVGMLALMLQYLAIVELWIGRIADAEADLVEALELARETGQVGVESVLLALDATVAALRGEEARCRQLAADSLAIAQERGLELAVSAAGYALGLLELGLGAPGIAADHLDRVANRPASHPVYRMMAVPDLVEASVRSGRADLAPAVDVAERRFGSWAAASDSPWTRSLDARVRALIGDDEDSGARFEQALVLHESAPSPWLRARTELLYGEHLRRHLARARARAYLRSARDTFVSLGTTPWAERAGAELRATGETVDRRPNVADSGLTAADELTPQELQVARLVAAGARNREVAAQLFVTTKTVEYHLAKVFRKLGISSRTELARVLDRAN